MRHSVCVFCASSEATPSVYREAAARVGQLCAEHHLRLVYGAGAIGLMGLCADSCLANGGRVVGVIPRFMVERGWHHTGLAHVHLTPDMGTRKQTMRNLSQGILALAGGCGTLEELLESITQRQLGLFPHPIVILNTAGFYDPLLAQLQHAIDERFMRSEHARLWAVAHTPEEAVHMFLTLPDISEPFEKRVLK